VLVLLLRLTGLKATIASPKAKKWVLTLPEHYVWISRLLFLISSQALLIELAKVSVFAINKAVRRSKRSSLPYHAINMLLIGLSLIGFLYGHYRV